MGTAPGSLRLVKAGFVLLDGVTGVVQRVIVFQYNPETLVRRLEAAPVTTSGTGLGSTGVAVPGGAALMASVPQEFVSFTLALDAADKLEVADPLTLQTGLLPMIAALELLLSPPPGSFTVWVSGSHRILPVRISEMVLSEQAFDPLLNPIRADVSVRLQVLKDAEFPANSRGRAIWDAHYAQLQQLANTLAAGKLSSLGLSGI